MESKSTGSRGAQREWILLPVLALLLLVTGCSLTPKPINVTVSTVPPPASTAPDLSGTAWDAPVVSGCCPTSCERKCSAIPSSTATTPLAAVLIVTVKEESGKAIEDADVDVLAEIPSATDRDGGKAYLVAPYQDSTDLDNLAVRLGPAVHDIASRQKAGSDEDSPFSMAAETFEPLNETPPTDLSLIASDSSDRDGVAIFTTDQLVPGTYMIRASTNQRGSDPMAITVEVKPENAIKPFEQTITLRAIPSKSAAMRLPEARFQTVANPSLPEPQPPRPRFEPQPIYFATSRLQNPDSRNELFSDDPPPLNSLTFGTCEVQLKVDGSYNRNFEVPANQDGAIDRKKCNGIATRQAFLDNVGAVARKKGGRILVFVHGFKNSFDGAAVRAARLAQDLKFDGPVILFSWASVNRVYKYSQDETTAQNSIFVLEDLLDDLAKTSSGTNITVAAHSLGNSILLEALRRTRQPTAQVFLLDPDVDESDWRRTYGPKIQNKKIFSTMYVASGDLALLASTIEHGFFQTWNFTARAGATPQFVEGTDTIDMTRLELHAWPLSTLKKVPASLMLNHSMWTYNSLVIRDLKETFTNSKPALRSNLDTIRLYPVGQYFQLRP
jgi:esterase/lipase superfamily enzyme